MERAYCGLDCTKCDAFIATKNNDESLRKKTAKEWSKMYSADIKPKDINCTGCKSDGIKISHSSYCEVRKCNISKGYKSCGECPNYPCEHISFIVDNVPDAKEYIESIKK